ncbi:MAG: tripartite tricarboxylate transporter TctB family protein [Hyphomicrobiaceae bacterium]
MLRKADFWSGVFWLIVALFVVWQGKLLGLGKLSDPGSGFAVFWIGVLLVLFSVSVIVSAARGQHGPILARLWDDARWGRVLAVVALLIGYGAVFEWAGFVVSTIVLLLVLMLAVDRVRPWLAVTIAVSAPLIVWFAMTKWLKIQMPAGFLSLMTG